jgi:hypothetical protein
MPDDGSTMATRWARVARGLTAASFAVFVTAFAHVAGGGQLPSFAGFALAFAFAALVCIALAGHRISRVRVAASVILSQGALHLLFLLTGGGHDATTIPAMNMQMPGASTSIQLAATSATVSMYASGWMWLAHGAAALLTIVALLWSEKAFWGVYETSRLALARSLRVARLRPSPRSIAAPRIFVLSPYRRSAGFLLAGLRHRGPPSGVAASA